MRAELLHHWLASQAESGANCPPLPSLSVSLSPPLTSQSPDPQAVVSKFFNIGFKMSHSSMFYTVFLIYLVSWCNDPKTSSHTSDIEFSSCPSCAECSTFRDNEDDVMMTLGSNKHDTVENEVKCKCWQENSCGWNSLTWNMSVSTWWVHGRKTHTHSCILYMYLLMALHPLKYTPREIPGGINVLINSILSMFIRGLTDIWVSWYYQLILADNTIYKTNQYRLICCLIFADIKAGRYR